jgi:two-component system, OmpR family, sensor histidine kinase MprB
VSFRLRLTLLAAVAIALVVVSTAAAVLIVARHQLRSQVDSGLKSQVAAVEESHHGLFGVPYVLLSSSGAAVSPNPYGIPITAPERRVASGSITSYFGDQHISGVHARVYAESVAGGGALVVAASLGATDRALSRIKFWIFLIGGVGIALAAGVAAIVAAAALTPIRRLTAAAESVAATGSLAERVEVSGDDELGRLAARFNDMLAALERSVGAQRRLVADASHELRTPLTAVRTNLDLLREGKLPADEAQRALDESSVELDGLTTLVADLVELARGEERKLRIEDVHLDDLVATVVERAKSRAPHMTFITSLAPAHVSADPVLLERAISNLIDNAVKWSPAGGPVEVTVRGGEVVVTDHGPGIAEEDLPRIFDRFYRAATARSKPGAGLGLAIVREAATAHGGTATVENAAHGARFRLTLPVAA